MSQHQNRRQFWRAHLERCRGLGITLKAYAEQEGLTVSVFYGWSKRLKREESVGAGAAFSRVRVAPSGGADFRLRFPCGLVLEWSGEADSGQLTRLVKALA